MEIQLWYFNRNTIVFLPKSISGVIQLQLQGLCDEIPLLIDDEWFFYDKFW